MVAKPGNKLWQGVTNSRKQKKIVAGYRLCPLIVCRLGEMNDCIKEIYDCRTEMSDCTKEK